MITEIDTQQSSVLCYAAVSWFGKTALRFIEDYAAQQDHLAPSKRKKKTVNQIMYREEMCLAMFEDIDRFDFSIGFLAWDGASWFTEAILNIYDDLVISFRFQ